MLDEAIDVSLGNVVVEGYRDRRISLGVSLIWLGALITPLWVGALGYGILRLLGTF
jgi:hypothetical protein